MQRIPLEQFPGQVFNIVLSGQYCTIALYWRQIRLYLDLSVGAQAVCLGAICENRTSVLQSPSRYFAGSLHFLDLEGERAPHWEQLHTGSAGRYVLLFVEAGEAFPNELRY